MNPDTTLDPRAKSEPIPINEPGRKRKLAQFQVDKMNEEEEEEEEEQHEELEWREIFCPHCKGYVRAVSKFDKHFRQWVGLGLQLITILSVWLQLVLT